MLHLLRAPATKGAFIGTDIGLAVEGQCRITLLALGSHFERHQTLLAAAVWPVVSGRPEVTGEAPRVHRRKPHQGGEHKDVPPARRGRMPLRAAPVPRGKRRNPGAEGRSLTTPQATSCRFLKQFAANQHTSNFTCTGTDLIELGVTQQASGRVLIDIAVSA